MAFSVTVSSRTVNPDGSIQYQFANGFGVVFATTTEEQDWCDQSDIESQIRGQIMRIAVRKTIDSGTTGKTVSYDIDAVGGNVVQVT